MRPNLFDFATKELSQDAFLAWLIQWASPECKKHDSLLSVCASRFVKRLLSLQITPPIEITSVKAGRQWENIDVWAEVNDKYLLVLEDKVDTEEHSKQLQRYKKRAAEWCEKSNFQAVYIYLKTGSESASKMQNIERQGFAVFRRSDFLEILDDSHVTNNIFNDFREYLQVLEDKENQFWKKPIKEWHDLDWKGFYQALEKRRPIVNWERVNPPAGGGFWNAVLNWHETRDCCPYMQIEQGPLCFKIGEVRVNRIAIRKYYHTHFLNHCKGKVEIRRPNRFGCGMHMTIACVDKVKWLGSDDDFVDMDAVLMRLDDYESVYSAFIKRMASDESALVEE